MNPPRVTDQDQPQGGWVRDAWAAAGNLVAAAGLASVALWGGIGWLWAAAGLWTCLAGHRGWAALRSHRRGGGDVRR